MLENLKACWEESPLEVVEIFAGGLVLFVGSYVLAALMFSM